ncbi:hypothetical protein ElyMa_004334600 [Elysia marginata]|uniref:Uncharacterized protein n=1 Tax=Elysia marginata TaxID=1093978 RepID=A0AAV4H1D6_9GAST|nr:hypothetical protein ElyMa_004334600 [Elysia marginata]
MWTKCPYSSVTTTADPHALAVGKFRSGGVDLITTTGQLSHQLDPLLPPSHMEASKFGRYVFMTTDRNTIAKLELVDQAVEFDSTVREIKCPDGLAVLPTGEIVVADFLSRSLHLLQPNGKWLGRLWHHPADGEVGDRLSSVSCDDEVCVTCTWQGPAYVLQI